MAKTSHQKLKILYLLQYLLHRSDEDHPVTMADILSYLAGMDIAAERKSIYDDMEALRTFGIDVQSVRMGSVAGYFIGERDFQLPELKLLVDSVQSSKFITEKKSLELIAKLERLSSDHHARLLHRQVYVRGRIKNMDESIYYSVDTLYEAIDQDRAVTFRYYEWNPTRQRVFRHEGQRYVVSPWALMWENENYYLITYDHAAGITKHFRVDKISDIEITDEPRQGAGSFADFSMADYTDTHFGMFSGEAQQVRLAFHNILAGAVIDRFGSDAMLVPIDDEHFSVTIRAAVNVQFFGWLCGFGDKVRILSPDSVVQQMQQHLDAITQLYR